MKNIFSLVLALFMFALIVPVSAMPIPSVDKTEKTFKKEVVIKATIVVVEVFNVAESPSVKMPFCEIFIKNDRFKSKSLSLNKFYSKPSRNQVKDSIVLLKTENHKIKSRYSPQKLC